MIPIIFAVSLVLLPSLVTQFLSSSGNPHILSIAKFFANNFTPKTLAYNAFYFVLVLGFTFFYTAVVFNPEKISENLQKNGGFIPGILPSFFQNAIGVANLAIGGTSILIVVSVVLDITRELEAQLVMKKYDTFIH